MSKTDSWQTAEISGPKKASLIIKPEIVEAMLRKARRPIMIVGHGILEYEVEGRKMIDCLIELSKRGKIPVIATASTNREFLNRGFSPAAMMPAVDIGNRLTDPHWKGLDGKDTYDLAIFAGLPYYMEWTILSGLKNFAPHLRTMNSTIKDWAANLTCIVNNMGD